MKKAPVLSTICISLFAAQSALAQEVPNGCFSRVYDAAHLAAHPAQVVEAMWLNLVNDPAIAPEPTFRIGALLANQGHVAAEGFGGRIFSETGYCQDAATCLVTCDGGGFAVTRVDGDMIEITTSHVRVTNEDECGGGEDIEATSLAEVVGQPVVYRLYRADDVVCAPN